MSELIHVSQGPHSNAEEHFSTSNRGWFLGVSGSPTFLFDLKSIKHTNLSMIQHDRAFQKQDNVFLNGKNVQAKKSKSGVRYYKKVGLGKHSNFNRNFISTTKYDKMMKNHESMALAR